jgi:hypothetical protein
MCNWPQRPGKIQQNRIALADLDSAQGECNVVAGKAIEFNPIAVRFPACFFEDRRDSQ